MDTDRPSQEGREDVPSELSFLVSVPEADPMPVVTRSSEGTRPELTSAMVTRSRAREGRGINVAPEAQIEPEVETRPEPEIKTYEEGLGALDHTQPTLVVCLHSLKQLLHTIVRK